MGREGVPPFGAAGRVKGSAPDFLHALEGSRVPLIVPTIDSGIHIWWAVGWLREPLPGTIIQSFKRDTRCSSHTPIKPSIELGVISVAKRKVSYPVLQSFGNCIRGLSIPAGEAFRPLNPLFCKQARTPECSF